MDKKIETCFLVFERVKCSKIEEFKIGIEFIEVAINPSTPTSNMLGLLRLMVPNESPKFYEEMLAAVKGQPMSISHSISSVISKLERLTIDRAKPTIALHRVAFILKLNAVCMVVEMFYDLLIRYKCNKLKGK
jgi:hypothetical protein